MFGNDILLFLSKLLPIFLYPLGLTLVLSILGGICALLDRRRLALANVGAAATILWICSTPAFAAWAIASLERQYPPRTIAETPAADVAIVLGGILGQPLPPRVEADLSDTADRILHAARLYRAGKVKRILVSAGNIPWMPVVKPEAELIKELLVEWGVDADAIELGTASRNTVENARELQHLWKAGAFKSGLLVTSATHMPRAMAALRRAGLPVIAATVDLHVVEGDHADPLRWLPNAGALAMTTNAMKEWLGLLAYKLAGHL
jgi:uncharacterized SAM-binding protein YcdF (DUF218 family)